jgi:hypothetical protein
MYNLLDSYLDILNSFQGIFRDSFLYKILDRFLDGCPVSLPANLLLL